MHAGIVIDIVRQRDAQVRVAADRHTRLMGQAQAACGGESCRRAAGLRGLMGRCTAA
jgi:hypothetical protein